MRPHWNSCITHFDGEVDQFIARYFARDDRRCLLVAGAGFDPRSQLIADKLHRTLGARLYGFLVREERGDPAAHLQQEADNNERAMQSLIPLCHVEQIRVFDPDDGAPVSGQRIVEALDRFQWPDNLTDIVLDASALSTGVCFPMARYLLARSEAIEGLNFHIMISSNPELDVRIIGEPYSDPTFVRGFVGDFTPDVNKPIARIWLPQLASGRMAVLRKIRGFHGDAVYKICPILPFPSRNPRRADDLIVEYLPLLTDEGVDPRDFIYVSERDPLDSFRKISTLKIRYDRTVEDIYSSALVLSPVGSKVMALGAMMAAIEHGLPVQHVENLRYDFDPNTQGAEHEKIDLTVHVWLHGPIYAGFAPPESNE